MRLFDQKVKVRKALLVNRFFLSERCFFDQALRSLNDFLTLKNVLVPLAHVDNRF